MPLAIDTWPYRPSLRSKAVVCLMPSAYAMPGNPSPVFVVVRGAFSYIRRYPAPSSSSSPNKAVCLIPGDCAISGDPSPVFLIVVSGAILYIRRCPAPSELVS